MSAAEGQSGTTPFTFVVTLSNPSALAVSVNYTTADGTATTADHDYVATSGIVTFAPGQTAQTIVVNVTGDTAIEPNETFTVTLSNPTNATIADGTGSYTMSLFAQGLDMPDGGMIYRPATNDFLVNEEFTGHILRVDAATGAVSLFADVTSLVAPNRGAYLFGLAINSAGEVFAPAYDQGPVLRFDAAGNYLGSFTTPGQPYDAAFDSQDNLYVVVGHDSIYRYAKGTSSAPTLYASGFAALESIRFNAADQLIANDWVGAKVYRVTPGGLTIASHIVLADGVSLPDALAIEPNTQDVFVGGDANGDITRISTSGGVSTIATGVGTAPPRGPGDGRLQANGFDAAGNLYVADKFGGAIWKFTPPASGTATGVIINDDALPTNHAPAAVADSATTLQEVATDITVLANDTDVDGDVLTVTNVSAGAHGATISIAVNNIVHYVPAAGFTGSDIFTYQTAVQKTTLVVTK